MKEYIQEEKPDFTAKEPQAIYERLNKPEVNNSNISHPFEGMVQPKARTAEDYYNVLITEADSIYGKKDAMSVEEYFGKLRYLVKGYYEKIQGKD